MPKKDPIHKYDTILVGFPVSIKVYKSVIRISDKERNFIDIEKRKGRFHLTLKGLFSFKN